jgi:hypothetical protein
MNYKHYHKVSEFKELSTFFFEYVRELESEVSRLTNKLEFLTTKKVGLNPHITDIDQISVRLYNILKRYFDELQIPKKSANLLEIYDVDFQTLLNQRNCGKACLIELNRIFNHYGLPSKKLPK